MQRLLRKKRKHTRVVTTESGKFLLTCASISLDHFHEGCYKILLNTVIASKEQAILRDIINKYFLPINVVRCSFMPVLAGGTNNVNISGEKRIYCPLTKDVKLMALHTLTHTHTLTSTRVLITIHGNFLVCELQVTTKIKLQDVSKL